MTPLATLMMDQGFWALLTQESKAVLIEAVKEQEERREQVRV